MFGIDTQDIQDLKIVDVKVGTGAEAKPGELVRVHYTGWLEDGTKLIPALTATNPSNSRSVQDMLSRAGTAALPA